MNIDNMTTVNIRRTASQVMRSANIATTARSGRMLVTLLLMLLTTATAWADSAFSGGDGSQDNPYKIANTADLDQLASDVNGGNNYDGKNFVMTADITYDPNALTTDTDGDGIIDSNFTPIGFNGKSFAGVTIDATDRSVTSTDGSVCFKGTYSPIIWDNKNQTVLFLGAENTLYFPQPKDGQNPRINAFRAYFQLSDGAGVREFRLNFGDEEASSIENGKLKIENEAGAWYDLSGRRLDGKLTKAGLYINNGVKVVIK